MSKWSVSTLRCLGFLPIILAMLLLTLWVVLRFCCCYWGKWKWWWSPNTKLRRMTMSKNFLPDHCLWSWGRQARQGRLSVAQSGATITSASPDSHLTGGVDDPNFQAEDWSSDRGRSSRHSVRGPPRPFLCQAGWGGYNIISVWTCMEAVKL